MTGSGPHTLLADPQRAGTCFVQADERAALAAAAAALGFKVVAIDLASALDRQALLDAFAAAFGFPPTFGNNWDALADSLADLSWLPAPGYLLLLDHPTRLREAAPRGFDTLLEILDDTTRSHASAGVPFWTVLPPQPRAATHEASAGPRAAN